MRKKKKIGLPIRTLIAMFAVTLLLGGAIGGTMAWLTAETDNVVNTFTPSNITIILDEDTKKNDETLEDYQYKMVPGDKFAKDPWVKVNTGSEKCYLFVAITESTEPNLSDYIEYEVSDAWTKLSGYENIYYRTVTETDDFNEKLYILEGDATVTNGTNGIVTVKETVTKNMMDDIAVTEPTLTFNACAVQYDNIEDEDEAWDNVPAAFKVFAEETSVEEPNP